VQEYAVQYIGNAEGEASVVAILNTREGPVYADAGKVIPGTEVEVLGRTPDGQSLKVRLNNDVARLPLNVTAPEASGVQPTPQAP